MTDARDSHTAEPPESTITPPTELAPFALSITALMAITIVIYFESAHGTPVAGGLYAILAAVAVISADHWMIGRSVARADRSVARAEARVRREVAEDDAVLATELKAELAELRNEVAGMKAALLELTKQRPRASGTASCRSGGLYVSGRQETTVGIQMPSVDAATDPAGVALQRAHEDGVEKGFDLGLRVNLADKGVTQLQPRVLRRLTGDS